MKFSIITPTKNAARFIDKTILSVSKQISNSFEHIIIDSNSADGTFEIIQNYEKTYPLKFISGYDSNISEAFNEGIRLSSGKWLIFFGAGDEFINHKVLFEMEKELELKKEELIVWGNIIYIGNDGQVGNKESGKFPKRRLKRYMCLPHQAAFHNRILFERYGLFDEKLPNAMDYDLCLRSYNSISSNGYINKDISYMLYPGQCHDYKRSIKDFMIIQKKNNIWSFNYTPELLWLWAQMKYFIKKIIRYNSIKID